MSGKSDPARRTNGETISEFVRELPELFSNQSRNIGYPISGTYDFSEFAREISDVFRLKLNNVGPANSRGSYVVNSKSVENRVLSYFYELWGFDTDSTWGYVTASGTDGNLQALYVARELFPDAILYFSKDSHYSIKKIAKILRLSYEEVDSLPNGEMDLENFEKKIKKNGEAFSAIVSANLGTTMKGAYDDVEKIREILVLNGKGGRHFLHADAALMGWVLPLARSDVSFKRHVHSIAVSGHKFPGVPFPCGIVAIDRNANGKNGCSIGSVSNFVEYISCEDSTISGSRSGIAPLFLAHVIEKIGKEGFSKDITKCFECADRLIYELRSIGLEAWRNELSITVVLPRPSNEITSKWQLASEGDISHVVVMPHVTDVVIREFIEDLKKSRR